MFSTTVLTIPVFASPYLQGHSKQICVLDVHCNTILLWTVWRNLQRFCSFKLLCTSSFHLQISLKGNFKRHSEIKWHDRRLVANDQGLIFIKHFKLKHRFGKRFSKSFRSIICSYSLSWNFTRPFDKEI